MFIAAPFFEFDSWDAPISGGRHQRFAVARERQLHDPCGKLAVAHEYAHHLARCDTRRQTRERDRLVEGWAERAARDLAIAAIGAHRLMRAQHAALVDQHEA